MEGFFTALELARSLNRAGLRVFVADSAKINLCTYSNAVQRNFLIPSPRFEYEKFQNSLSKIVKENNIDLIIPVFEKTLYLAKAKEALNCELFFPSFSILNHCITSGNFIFCKKN